LRRKSTEEKVLRLDFETKHTVAHLLMKVLPEFSGVDEGQLSEEIFEGNAILIYSREPGEFKTYGLKHVFDNSLQELLESAKDFTECPFESSDQGCYFCLHKAVGCDTFNTRLSKTRLKAAMGWGVAD